MSRHRYIKNLNIADELDDDALSDGGEEEEMTAEEQLQMNDALEKVREVIGEEEISGLPDSEVKDTIWHYHFNVQDSIDWCLQEQEKRRAARERQGSPPVQYTHYEATERPRIPLIHLAQQRMAEQQQRYWEEHNAVNEEEGEIEYETVESEGNYEQYPPRRSLTPITEKTERTEISSVWRRAPTDATSTSYGDLISSGRFEPPPESPRDPNTIPLSPSESALHRLSLYEPAPTRTSSGTRSSISSLPRPPSVSVPPIDTIPDIPDSTSTLPATQQSFPGHLQQKPAKQSKLAQLASSRTSSRTKSSASLGTEHIESVKTYPGLRPAEESTRPLSSVVPRSIAPSSTSFHVDKAIQFAIEMEEQDRAITNDSPKVADKPLPKTPSARSKLSEKARSSASPSKSISVFRPAAPTPSKAPQMPSTDSPGSAKPLSKLAQLAQEKAARADVKKFLNTPLTRPPPGHLPPEHTEYLVPVANGPTVTTAITTSYQTLYSLTDPSRVATGETPYVVPLPTMDYGYNTTQTSMVKPSKLAMKIRKAHEKQAPQAVEENPAHYQVPSMFLPHSSRSRASPSAFASVLVDNGYLNHEGGEETKKDKGKGKEKARSTTSSASTIKHHRSTRRKDRSISDVTSPSAFSFDVPSPDDIVLNAHLDSSSSPHHVIFMNSAKEREKAKRLESAAASRTASPLPKKKGPTTPAKSGVSTPTPTRSVDQRTLDISGLNLNTKEEKVVEEPPPKVNYEREKLLEEAKKALDSEGKRVVSLVVIGHVDAGKSTLMGRLLYEVGRLDEKTKIANERGSSKAGKSSFSWAWNLDGTIEERERGITMDIALQSLATPNRQITVLDAPGHKDFIPNMISGASQADCALLVVDATVGEFEAGFERGGQTREHILLVRSLGVSQVIVAVNKLDQVEWDKSRYDEIRDFLKPFLIQSGFQPSKTKFVPVGAMLGVNLVSREGETGIKLNAWYDGPTLVDYLAITVEDDNVPWASAGTSLTIQLTSIDPVHLNIGSVLCPPHDLVPLATIFTARIIVFDTQIPITSGASIELFHHSRDVPATVSNLIATIDRGTGKIVKKKPRVLTKGVSAEVQIALRTTSLSGPSIARPIPLEPFSVSKDMGRVLLRRGGETIGAGIVLEIFG
ncbi:hypothetical protein V5O48_001254 [Marasmius crinis-equi]|uniref:Tr-type G domain-containing protein n=1 Tax=Marasmius crinis-equi TaxID=585013 RepID=A0ABR3FZH7_9AGAR